MVSLGHKEFSINICFGDGVLDEIASNSYQFWHIYASVSWAIMMSNGLLSMQCRAIIKMTIYYEKNPISSVPWQYFEHLMSSFHEKYNKNYRL